MITFKIKLQIVQAIIGLTLLVVWQDDLYLNHDKDNHVKSKIFAFGLPDLPWSWDRVPLWADFDIRDWRTPWYTIDQAKFMGETYYVLSLEKCLGGSLWYSDPELEGEEAFYELATAIRNFTNSNDTKILFYWNIDIL